LLVVGEKSVGAPGAEVFVHEFGVGGAESLFIYKILGGRVGVERGDTLASLPLKTKSVTSWSCCRILGRLAGIVHC
jgi:hypothetical protein